MIPRFHAVHSLLASMLALGSGSAGFQPPGRSESAVRRAEFGSNKYTPFKGVSADIVKHNKAIDAAKQDKKADFGLAIRGQRKKIAARSRKLQNMQRNGRVPNNASYIG